jgi:hypothetical protein
MTPCILDSYYNTQERWQSWSNASDLKSEETLRFPWVRIPLSPLAKAICVCYKNDKIRRLGLC